jgi:hypothetical protein
VEAKRSIPTVWLLECARAALQQHKSVTEEGRMKHRVLKQLSFMKAAGRLPSIQYRW